MRQRADWPEIGRDVLDPPDESRRPRWRWLPRRRPALGVRSSVAPPLVFVIGGILLGPYGVNVLSNPVLSHLDVVVSVALAILGVFVGLGTTSIPAGLLRRSVAGGAIGSAVTIAVVALGLGLLIRGWGLLLPVDTVAYATMIGLCASASAALHLPGDEVMTRATYLADADDVTLVVVGTVAIAVLSGGSATSVALRLSMTAVAGAAVGVAGWLLFERASGPAERGVFVTGAVLLLAGIGGYLGTSPLLVGGVAALVWVRAPGSADRITAADLRVLQHPLVSLLLLVAGALIEWTPAVLWVAGAVVLLRLLGKLVASFAMSPVAQVRPGVLATALLPPGVMGVALALNVRQVLGSDAGSLVAVITAAALASETLAGFLPREVAQEL